MTHDGLPVEFYIHAGGEADLMGMKALSPRLPASRRLYADAAYTDYAYENAWHETEQVQLLVARWGNSKLCS